VRGYRRRNLEVPQAAAVSAEEAVPFIAAGGKGGERRVRRRWKA